MKFKWIAALGVLVAFSGCHTVHRRPIVNLQTAQSPAVNHSLASKAVGKLATEPTKPEVVQVGYQEDGSDGEMLSESQSGLVTVVTDPANDIGTAGKIFTLSEIEQIALANNPALSAAESNLQKSSGLFRQVGMRPNPTLGYAANQLADQGTDQHTVFLEQEFVRGNKLALNRQVLKHTYDAQILEIETQRQRILTDVRIRFYEAIAAQHALEATLEFAKVANRGLEVAENLQEAGEGTLVDVLQSKTLISEISLAQEQAEATYQGAWKDLAAIAGMPEMEPVSLSGDLTSLEQMVDWDVTYNTIVSQSPELAAANAIVEEKRALVQRQKVQMIPNITGQLGAGYDRGTDSGLINLQISAPIPTRNKNCGNIAAANAEYHRAVENVRRIELAIKSRLARAAQEFESADAAVKKYKQEILPQVEESLSISEKAYQAGELAFLQVLVVRRNYYDSKIRYIQSQGRLAQANANIEGLLLTGGLDAPQDYTDGDGLRGQSFGGQ